MFFVFLSNIFSLVSLFLLDIGYPAASPFNRPDIPYSLTVPGLPWLTISGSPHCDVVRICRSLTLHIFYVYISIVSKLPLNNLQEILCDCMFHPDICCCIGCHKYLGSLHGWSHMGGYSSDRCSRILCSISADLSESCPLVQSACQECERRDWYEDANNDGSGLTWCFTVKIQHSMRESYCRSENHKHIYDIPVSWLGPVIERNAPRACIYSNWQVTPLFLFVSLCFPCTDSRTHTAQSERRITLSIQ